MDLFFDTKLSPADFDGLFECARPVMFIDCQTEPTEEQWVNYNIVANDENPSEFPFGYSFCAQDSNEEENELWLMLVARTLSVRLKCKALYTGCPVDMNSPYYCVVFDRGVAYLGDDMETVLMDEGERPVEIIKRLPLLDCPTKCPWSRVE